MNAHSPQSQRTSPLYVPALTGIRAIAALLVLVLHTTQNVPVPLGTLQPIVNHGHLGVDLFFVLSGFIIAHVYGGLMLRPSPRAIGIYLWHRLIRLYPVHVAVLLALVMVVWLAQGAGIVLNEARAWPTVDIIWNLLLVHAWGVIPRPSWNVPSWSISAEWFAYLLFPAMAWLALRVRRARVAILIAIAALAGAATIFEMTNWTLNAWTGAPALVRVSAEFFCGLMLRRALALDDLTQQVAPYADAAGWLSLLSFALLAWFAAPEFALVALLAILVPAAATARGTFQTALANRPMIWLGDISYSLYMVHFPVLVAMRRVWEGWGISQGGPLLQWLAFMTTVLIVLLAAAALFVCVEQPMRRRLRDRFGTIGPDAQRVLR